MRGKISVFGIVAGIIIIALYAALLLGWTKSEEFDHSSLMDETITVVMPAISIGLAAAVVAFSFVRNRSARGVLFLILGNALLILAGGVLSIYAHRDTPSGNAYYQPFNFIGWANILDVKYAAPMFTVAHIVNEIIGVMDGYIMPLWLGALFFSATANSLKPPRIVVGWIAITNTVLLVYNMTFLTIWGYHVNQPFPPEHPDYLFMVYLIAFGVGFLAVIVLSILIFASSSAARGLARASVAILIILAVTEPLVLLLYALGKAQVCKFLIADSFLYILPIVLAANGVSLIFRHFAPQEKGLSPAAPIELGRPDGA